MFRFPCDLPEQLAETFNLFNKQRHQRFRRTVTPGKAGASSGDYYLNVGAGNPL